MKNLCAFLLFGILLLAFGPAHAQNDKALRKEWAKRMKNMDPLEFKRIVEERQTALNEAQQAKKEVSDLQSELTRLRTQNESMQGRIRRLEAEAAAPKPEPSDNSSQLASVAPGATRQGQRANPAGVVFKVQIGAFRNKDLEKYLKNNNGKMSAETDENGMVKYTLGEFGDYWEADHFKKYLREMGVKDAWIVSYKNGQRVEIKDVLEGTI